MLNGTSSAIGWRDAHSEAMNASRSFVSSVSGSTSGSAAPGSSVRSSSVVAPKCCSTHAWNAVPRRVCGAGAVGTGRRSDPANSCASACHLTNWDTEICWGTVRFVRVSVSMRSASSSSTSRSISGSVSVWAAGSCSRTSRAAASQASWRSPSGCGLGQTA
nr:hypothetical protein [Stackebrandtia endophytica]